MLTRPLHVPTSWPSLTEEVSAHGECLLEKIQLLREAVEQGKVEARRMQTLQLPRRRSLAHFLIVSDWFRCVAYARSEVGLLLVTTMLPMIAAGYKDG